MLKKTIIASILSMGILAGMGTAAFAASENANQLASQYRIVSDGGIPDPTTNGLFRGMFCVPETDFDYDDHIVFGTRIVPKKDAPELDRANVDLEVEIYTGNGEQYLFSLDSAPHPFGPGMRASIDPTEDVLPPGDYQFKFKATLVDSEKKNKDVLRWEPENNTFTIVEDIDRPAFPE